MQPEYSVAVCRDLEETFRQARLHRPMRIQRYDAGTELVRDITAVGGESGRVHLVVERFVGGGFAGQVYRVRVTALEGGPVGKLEVDGIYAMKVLIPPSGGALLFRNLLYWIGFQGPFQLQVNPEAARSGALWQKFIRRAMRVRFGDEGRVNDIHATFVDPDLGSCGELSDWVAGRTWRLEVDDRLDALRRWGRGKTVDAAGLGSPEYRAKKEFMQSFVRLLDEVGAHEFARQYEWSTCKSQPNCLKRIDTEDDPSSGLIAVDFRAGLTLLPFLPMSPGDFKLILKGLGRGSLVQFDRGDLRKLEAFVEAHEGDFADMRGALEQLKAVEETYRNSIPDVTHNRLRLLYSRKLWATLMDSAVTGWDVRNLLDERHVARLRGSRFRTTVYWLLGLIPFLGTVLRKLWGHAGWRRHYGTLLASPGYLIRALRGRFAEKLIVWHRAGRVDGDDAGRLSGALPRALVHLPLSLLPVGIHKFLTNGSYARERLDYIFVRPVRLYFNAQRREQWLRDMVVEGQTKHIVNDEDAGIILSKIEEPFIQKYLKSLAVHVCTLPVTQVVSLIAAVAYVMTHPEMPRAQSWAMGAGIIAAFQVTPISPGSLLRGLYVVYLVIRERNFKDYNIAVFLGFFKYVGYLAFPIQMTQRYPELARFMAGHWATETVHIVPVFGERGALLERWVFCLFYNWPLTIARRMRKRFAKRAALAPRYWHAGLCAAVAAGLFWTADRLYLSRSGELPVLRDIWWLALLVPLACGMLVTLGARGASMGRRIIAGVACGILTGLLYTAATTALVHESGPLLSTGDLAARGAWRLFAFSLFSTAGVILTELLMADPDVKRPRN